MTELEYKVINKFVEDGTIKFFGRFVDDTLVLIKSKDTGFVHETLRNFGKS